MVRPSEWIDLDELNPTDEKFVGLYSVEPSNTNNYLTVYATNDYTVDWGDGTVENYSSATIAYHEYDYAAIDAETEFTASEGLNRTLYLRGTMMNRAALIDLFNGLATASGQTLDITGCPGADQIDAADISIATGKGWTLLY